MTPGTQQLAADRTDVILDARGVEVTIDGTAILHGVDLSVRRGEIHVLIGPNGAGKTTFANAITGHVAVTGGDIALDGVPLAGSVSSATYFPTTFCGTESVCCVESKNE